MTAPTLKSPRRLLGLDDLATHDFDALLDLAEIMRRHPLAWRSALEGQAVACLFEQPSTRGQVSLEVAVNRLGALPVVLEATEFSLAETAHALSSYCDAIAVRTGRHRDLIELAEHASVPVINAGTDLEDPCRALAECLTLRDRYGTLRGLRIAAVGASGPVTYSLIEAAMLAGMTVRVTVQGADPALLARAGSAVEVCATPREAVLGAAAVYAGDDSSEQRLNLLGVEQAVLRALVTGDWEL
jgi:ornithine carbamoyltransferase